MPLFWKAFITLGLASSPSKSQIELAVPRALTEGGCQASVVPGQPQVSSAPKRKLRQRAPHSLSGHASGTWQLQLRGTVMLRQKALRTCKNSAAISDKVDKLVALKKHGGLCFLQRRGTHKWTSCLLRVHITILLLLLSLRRYVLCFKYCPYIVNQHTWRQRWKLRKSNLFYLFVPRQCNPKRHDFTKNYLKTCNIPTCYTAFATNRNPVDL